MKSLMFCLMLLTLGNLGFASESDYEIVEVEKSSMILEMKARFEKIEGIEVEITTISPEIANLIAARRAVDVAPKSEPAVDVKSLPDPAQPKTAPSGPRPTFKKVIAPVVPGTIMASAK